MNLRTVPALLAFFGLLIACGGQNEAEKQIKTVLNKAGIKVINCPSHDDLGFQKDEPKPVAMMCGEFEDGPEAMENRLSSLNESYYTPTTEFQQSVEPVYTPFYSQSWRANNGDGDRMLFSYNPNTDLVILRSAETK